MLQYYTAVTFEIFVKLNLYLQRIFNLKSMYFGSGFNQVIKLLLWYSFQLRQALVNKIWCHMNTVTDVKSNFQQWNKKDANACVVNVSILSLKSLKMENLVSMLLHEICYASVSHFVCEERYNYLLLIIQKGLWNHQLLRIH